LDPRYTPSVEEQIEAIGKVTLQDQWKAKRAYVRIPDKLVDVPGATLSIDIPDKASATIGVKQRVPMNDTDPDYPAWLLVGQILGGGPGARLWERLRETEGLSYGAYASATAGEFKADATVAAQNLEKGKAAVLAEIQKVIDGGAVTEDQLAHAKQLLDQKKRNLSEDSNIEEALAAQVKTGRNMLFTKDLMEKVKAVTVRDIDRVAKKYLKPEKLVIVAVGDLKPQSKAK
jgi:zinc protease